MDERDKNISKLINLLRVRNALTEALSSDDTKIMPSSILETHIPKREADIIIYSKEDGYTIENEVWFTEDGYIESEVFNTKIEMSEETINNAYSETDRLKTLGQKIEKDMNDSNRIYMIYNKMLEKCVNEDNFEMASKLKKVIDEYKSNDKQS